MKIATAKERNLWDCVLCSVLALDVATKTKGQSVGACVVSVLCGTAPVTQDSSCGWVGTGKRSVALKLVSRDAK